MSPTPRRSVRAVPQAPDDPPTAAPSSRRATTSTRRRATSTGSTSSTAVAGGAGSPGTPGRGGSQPEGTSTGQGRGDAAPRGVAGTSERTGAATGRTAGAPISGAPDGLREPGQCLWGAITADYDLDPRERVVLGLACRQADDLAALEELVAVGMVVTGSTGQPRLAHAVAEARLARAALARLLDALELPREDEDAGMSPASRRAQHAAVARWERTREQREWRRAARVGGMGGPDFG